MRSNTTMQIQRDTRTVGRNVLTLSVLTCVLMCAVALYVTVASAGAPTAVPAQGKQKGGSTPTPSPTPTGCIQTWNVVDSPSPYQYSELIGVDAVSSMDVWAVGSGMIDHWDGSTWSVLTNTTF